MKSVPTIAFEYRPSRRLRTLLVTLAVLAIIGVMAAAMPWWSQGLLVVMVVIGLWRYRQREHRLAGCRLRWDSAGQWHLQAAGGQERPVVLEGKAQQAGFLVLRFRGARRVPLVLCSDNLEQTTYRHLRMRLSATTDIV
ncbi:protein YgfX [Oleiagrimonas sp. C23AA]|uniref:protein YgfX n=1 Tax=Oleiagrimonas sp. C23AA TaxID=2719047 RepID=UPI00141F1A97|nr:protein YgfX [Oleiagrimonas sp. C23AA]NII09643.1 hypothetical protein [Oleiagrimonas sp. C23AA]